MNDLQPPTGDFVYTHIFDAPRELVFRCMIEPKHLTHFWGPIGVSTPIETIKVEARPGGRFESIMINDADGTRYAIRATYVEVKEPERLVWVDADTGMTTTSTFVDLGDNRTEVRIHQTDAPETFRSPEAQAGFVTSLDRFAAYLLTVSPDSGSSVR
jgi:uncharacterized protein YndB with AHSA1/START domain